jgi:hypothetical protein
MSDKVSVAEFVFDNEYRFLSPRIAEPHFATKISAGLV